MTEISLDKGGLAEAPLGFLRHVLGLPADAGLFYAFGGSLERDDAKPTKVLRANVIFEPQAAAWWRDYRSHAEDRSADPIRNAIRHGTAPVRWRDYERRFAMSAAERGLWQRARDIGLRDAVTVPLHDPLTRRYGALSVIHFGALTDFDDWLGEHGGMLRPAACLAHLAIAAIVPLPSEGGLLSNREQQCLALVASGHSSKRIGRELQLSQRTVELHIARAIARLGAANRSHAFAIALQQNILRS
jgi:LuxR family transcriptional regulator, quorum-sensing system regulator BjaR1